VEALVADAAFPVEQLESARPPSPEVLQDLATRLRVLAGQVYPGAEGRGGQRYDKQIAEAMAQLAGQTEVLDRLALALRARVPAVDLWQLLSMADLPVVPAAPVA